MSQDWRLEIGEQRDGKSSPPRHAVNERIKTPTSTLPNKCKLINCSCVCLRVYACKHSLGACKSSL